VTKIYISHQVGCALDQIYLVYLIECP